MDDDDYYDSENDSDPADHELVQEKFREKIVKAEEEEVVRKKDLKKLREHLDKQSNAMKVSPLKEVVHLQ